MDKTTTTSSALKRELKKNRIFYIAVLLTATFCFLLLNWISTADLSEEKLWNTGLSKTYAPLFTAGYITGLVLQAISAVGAWFLYAGAKREAGDKLLSAGLLLLEIYFLVLTVSIFAFFIGGIVVYWSMPWAILPLTAACALIVNYFYNLLKTLFSASRIFRSKKGVFYASAYVSCLNYILAISGVVVACVCFIVNFFSEALSLTESLFLVALSVLYAILLIFLSKLINDCKGSVSAVKEQKRAPMSANEPFAEIESSNGAEAETLADAQSQKREERNPSFAKRIIFSVCIGLTVIIFGGSNFLTVFCPSQFTDSGVTYKRDKKGTFYTVTDFNDSGENSQTVLIRSNYHGIPIKRIGEGAFSGSDVFSVSIPDGVDSIETSAFSGCVSLRLVSIPESVVSIGERAFLHCWTLQKIVIPASVAYLGSNAFGDSTNLHIYCESERQPDGWADDWNKENRAAVYWSGSWEYANGAPVPIG